jgi:hypothetical protein
VAEIEKGVVAQVKRVSRGRVIYLRATSFDRDIQMEPKQVQCAGFNPRRVGPGDQMIVDVRIENNGNLKTSCIRSLNGKPARPTGPTSKR